MVRQRRTDSVEERIWQRLSQSKGVRAGMTLSLSFQSRSSTHQSGASSRDRPRDTMGVPMYTSSAPETRLVYSLGIVGCTGHSMKRERGLSPGKGWKKEIRERLGVNSRQTRGPAPVGPRLRGRLSAPCGQLPRLLP